MQDELEPLSPQEPDSLEHLFGSLLSGAAFFRAARFPDAFTDHPRAVLGHLPRRPYSLRLPESSGLKAHLVGPLGSYIG